MSKKMTENMTKTDIGNLGEDAAAKYMESNGFFIISRNYKTAFGEIDIIAKKDEYTVFCEVKSRKSTFYGEPSEAVNHEKQRKIRMSAYKYIEDNAIFDTNARFDVCEIIHKIENGAYIVKNINYIEGAFFDE